MSAQRPLDYDHLLASARALFPDSTVAVIYSPYETIHVDVDGHRFTFEIGSDDDEYVFTDGKTTFTVPLMDLGEDFWDFS